MNEIKSGVEVITPQIADEILEKSRAIRNRSVSKYKVKSYADQMVSKNWSLNGESIILNERGFCIDGQHRLEAVVSSGVTINSIVVRGVPYKEFDTIDTGMARNAGHVLGMSGYSNPGRLASFIRAIIRMSVYGLSGFGTSKSGKVLGVSNKEILTFAEDNKRAVLFFDTHIHGNYAAMYKDKTVHTSMIYSLMYLLWLELPNEVDGFMAGVSLCENMSATDPRLVISNLMFKEKLNVGSSKISNEVAVSLYAQAWNAYIDGREVRSLRKTKKVPKVRYL